MSKRLSQEEFIERCKEVHEDKYDYSKLDYVNSTTKVIIIDKKYGTEHMIRPISIFNKVEIICFIFNAVDKTKYFIEKSKQIHGTKYGYDKTIYDRGNKNIIILCSKHGEFIQTPSNHIRGNGCVECSIERGRLSKEEFIKRSEKIHNNKYNYSLVDYKTNSDKVIIICPTHGEFKQTPHGHLTGRGCRNCVGRFNITNEEIIKEGKHIHGDNYGYDKVEYVDSVTKIKIFCKEHDGYFHQTVGNHLRGNRCPICYGNINMELKGFIDKSIKTHGDKYDYSEVNYINNKTKVKIFCKEHNGYFKQRPVDHISGSKCGICYGTLQSNTEEFIKKAKKIHGKRYDYSEINYKSAIINIKIICKEHGQFLQTPNNHLSGRNCGKCSNTYSLSKKELIDIFNEEHIYEYKYDLDNYKNVNSHINIKCKKHGWFIMKVNNHKKGSFCPKCNKNISRGEKKIINLLDTYKVNYEYQHRIKECKNKRSLPFDFFITEKNILIEFDGKQHFKKSFKMSDENFESIKKRDRIKDKYCEDNYIYLVRIPYTEYNNIEEILIKNNIICYQNQ